MSIDLDIGALASSARAASAAAETFSAQASSASRAASSLGLGWRGGGYAAFSSLVEGSAVPGALVASGACRDLAGSLDDARRRASRLRSRAEGFASVLAGGGAAACSEGAESGRLFSDDACFDPIDADLANAEDAVSRARSAFWRCEDRLWGLKTRGVAMDGGGLASALSDISSRLTAFRGEFSSYRSEMAGLEEASSQASSGLSQAFACRPVSAVYEGGRVKDPAALAWWLSRPYASLSAEERELVDALKGEGLSMPRLYEEGLVAEGLSSAVRGPEDYEDLVDSLLSAAGYVVGAHEATFSLAEIIVKVESMGVSAADIELVKGAVKVLGRVGMVLNVASAVYSSYQYYDNHPELPEDRRSSNQSAELGLKFVQGFVGVIPPVEDWFVTEVYEIERWEDMTLAEHYYEWRYEFFGKYGL